MVLCQVLLHERRLMGGRRRHSGPHATGVAVSTALAGTALVSTPLAAPTGSAAPRNSRPIVPWRGRAITRSSDRILGLSPLLLLLLLQDRLHALIEDLPTIGGRRPRR